MKRLLKLLLALILFLVPISYTNSTYNPVIIKAVLAQGLLLLIFLILWLSISRSRDTFDFAPSLPISFYLLISIISFILSPYKHAAGVSVGELSKLITYISFFLVTFYILNKDNARKFLTVWSISAVLAAVIGIWDFRHRGVAIGSFGNPNLTASFMAITLPVLVGMFLTNVSKVGVGFIRPAPTGVINAAPTILKFLYITSIIIILFVLYLCKSRGAWLALAIGAISFLILSAINNKKRLIITVLAIAILSTVVLSCFLMPLTEELTHDVRPFIWRGTLNMIKAHPIIGSGIGTYVINYPNYRAKEYFFYSHTLGKEKGWQAQDVTDHAHSEYLEIAAETGLLGLSAFLSILIAFFILAIKTLRTVKGEINFILIGLTSSVIAALIDNTANISMRFPSTSLFFWFSIASSLAIIRDRSVYLPLRGKLQCRGDIYGARFAGLINQTPTRRFLNTNSVGLVIIILLLGATLYKTAWIDFRANLCLMRGVKYRANEEWGNAISHYKKATSIDPYLLTAHYRLAYAYNEIGDLDKAIETYKNILQIAPHYARAEANIGKLYMKKDMLDEALLYFRKAETLNPYDIDLLCSIGSLYIRLNDPKNAKCYLRRALTIEPGNEYANKVMSKIR